MHIATVYRGDGELSSVEDRVNYDGDYLRRHRALKDIMRRISPPCSNHVAWSLLVSTARNHER